MPTFNAPSEKATSDPGWAKPIAEYKGVLYNLEGLLGLITSLEMRKPTEKEFDKWNNKCCFNCTNKEACSVYDSPREGCSKNIFIITQGGKRMVVLLLGEL